MPKNDEKLKALDDMILQTDQLKSMILAELGVLTDSFNGMVQKMGGSDPKVMENALQSLNSFLKSSSNMMNALTKQIKEITNNAMKTKTMLDQVARMA